MPHPHVRGVPAIVALPAEIDLANRDEVHDRLCAAFICGATIVVADLTATTFCDCASLRCLLTVQQRAAARGGQLLLAMPPGSPVRRLMNLLELDHRLPVYSSPGEAADAQAVTADADQTAAERSS
jgi:stage II sporulation protein AA (anti-sigma F factor antagonist)